MKSTVTEIAYKLGRKLYCWARSESPNHPTRNGEYLLLARVLQLDKSPVTLLDIGANRGEWSREAVLLARSGHTKLKVHAFEPNSGTRAMLDAAVARLTEIKVESVALSNAAGTASFYSESAGAGTSSLHPVSGSQEERVMLTTLDAWFRLSRCGQVRMIKIDVEGFDSLVLEGATDILGRGLVDVVQFEYNWRWLLNSRSLYWVFEFIRDKPYVVGKLVSDGVLTFDRWHFELDRFFEGNYVLLRKGNLASQLGRPARFDESNVLRLD